VLNKIELHDEPFGSIPHPTPGRTHARVIGMPGRLLQRLKVGRDRVAHQAIHEGAQIHHTCRKIPEVSQVVEAAAQNMTRTMQ